MSLIYLGVDIGGTTCSVCTADEQGRLLGETTIPTGKGENGWEGTVSRLIGYARELVEANPGAEPRAIGISCGSPMDREAGIIQEPANLPGWRDVPIVSLLRDAFPQAAVHLENDANAGALAEYHFGAGRHERPSNMAFLTFGTGLGAGLVLNRQLYRGTSNYAGEIGHVRLEQDGPVGCGKAGSWEGFCSGGGIEQLAAAGRRSWQGETCLDKDKITAADVGQGALRGDELCLEILSTSGSYLGRGLGILVDILNLELIVIGSIFARCEEFLRPAMEAALQQEARRETLECCRVVAAALGEEIGLYSSLCAAYHGESTLEATAGASDTKA